MKPFTAFKFFVENKKKGMMTFIVIILTVCAVSLITGLIRSVFDTANDVNLKMFESISFFHAADIVEGLPQDVVDSVKADDSVREMLPANDLSYTSMKLTIGGNMSIPVIFTEYAAEYMNFTGNTLTEGRLPDSSAFEIAVHWRIMNNKGWKLGDEIGSDIDEDEFLKGKYEVVGILDGPSVTIVGGTSKQMLDYKKIGLFQNGLPFGYVVIPENGRLETLNRLLGGFDKNEITIYTYDSLKTLLDEILSGLSSLLTLLIIIVVFILSVSIGALMYLIYSQRSSEFGILAAMGYRRSFIRNLIVREVFSLNLFSWIIGILLAVGLVALLNGTVYTSKGLPLTLISTYSVVYTLIIPLMVAVFSLLPILRKLRRQDAITTIERRD
jgi:putative ABC transport system permease protein